MLPQKKTKYFSIMLAVVTFALIAGYTFFFLQVREKANGLAGLEEDLALELQREERSGLTRDLVAQTAQERAVLNSYFVAAEEEIDFLNEIEGLAGSSGTQIEISSVDVNEVSGGNASLDSLRVEFSALGTWGEQFHLLSLLEALPKAVSVDRVLIEQSDPESTALWRGVYRISSPIVE